MALAIATNNAALNAAASASSVNRDMETSMARLSSGKRINSASDDAAGVAISSRLSAEIRGTDQAFRNALDGQALIDTTEGAHKEVENILQRMREVAVQAMNDTNSSKDRINLFTENKAMSVEINRIASTTKWAGQTLMGDADGAGENSGTVGATFSFQVGASIGEKNQIVINIGSTDAEVYYLLLRETGLRVSELAGIQVGDVSLQDRSLHVQPNDIRGLKTKGSQRIIPLSDGSLAALQQHRQGKEDGSPVFPRYARTNGNTSLSAMMMKHFRKAITDPKKSLHSLRHRMKDALRNTGCGDELGKSILGHTTAGVSARYGSGQSVEAMREALEKVW